MSRDSSGIFNRFVTTTLPVKWPKSRRQAYQTIRSMGVYTGNLDKTSIFRKWTMEDSTYTEINRALLNDDLYTLQKHANYINDLHRAIKENRSSESITVYRGLRLDEKDFREIYIGMVFLWPTFTSTTRNSTVARNFGPYIFEIDASPNDGTYRADINNYSAYPGEQEVLFYPYSGFRVRNIVKDTRVIQLECVDTVRVESMQNSPAVSASSYTPTPTLGTSGFPMFGFNLAPPTPTLGTSGFPMFGFNLAPPTPTLGTSGFPMFGFNLAPPTPRGIRLVTPPSPHTHGAHCLRFHTPGTCGPNCQGVHCTFDINQAPGNSYDF